MIGAGVEVAAEVVGEVAGGAVEAVAGGCAEGCGGCVAAGLLVAILGLLAGCGVAAAIGGR